jgi:regulator of replication initiation timing
MEEKELTYSNLIAKDKAELDRIKMVLEVSTFREKYELDKRKNRTETIRLFAVALMTSIITLGTTYIFKKVDQQSAQIDKAQSELKELKKEYVSHSDPKFKKDYACQIAQINNPQLDGYVEAEKKKYEDICRTVSDAQEAIITQNNTIQNIDTTSAQNQNLIAQLSALEKNINTLQAQKSNAKSESEKRALDQQIQRANKLITATADSSSELKSAVMASQTIKDNVQKQIETVSEKDDNLSDIKWFKEGYFLQFNDMRILLQYLDKNIGIQVQVCPTRGAGRCEAPLATKQWITFDKPFDFVYKDTHYRISLKAIDHAGKNPFTLAAYIALEKVK